jgi:hypothetical protein
MRRRAADPVRVGLGRRVGGALLLVTVLLAVVVVTAARRPGSAGAAVVAPIPDPPAVGSCLTGDGLGYQVIPCAQQHLVEITRSWSGWDWDHRGVSGSGAGELCGLYAGSYLGTPGEVEGWTPIELRWLTVFASGPGEDAGPWGWRACAVFPRSNDDQLVIPPGFRGTLRGASTMAGRPVDLRSCYSAVGSLWLVTPCSVRHSGEFLAQKAIPAPGGRLTTAGRASLLGQCRTVVGRLIGQDVRSDPRVRIVLRDPVPGDGTTSIDSASPSDTTGAVVHNVVLRCAVEGAGGYRLSDSVIGIGSEPLPIS